MSLIAVTLVSAPNVLILILNRGKNNEYNVKINFEEKIDLYKFIEIKGTGTKYNLIGVITHIGESNNNGHFVAFCREPITNKKWFLYNDAIVKEVKNFKKEVIDFGEPYILFYQKEN